MLVRGLVRALVSGAQSLGRFSGQGKALFWANARRPVVAAKAGFRLLSAMRVRSAAAPPPRFSAVLAFTIAALLGCGAAGGLPISRSRAAGAFAWGIVKNACVVGRFASANWVNPRVRAMPTIRLRAALFAVMGFRPAMVFRLPLVELTAHSPR